MLFCSTFQMPVRRHRERAGLSRSTVHGVVFAFLYDPSCRLQAIRVPKLISRCSESIVAAASARSLTLRLNFFGAQPQHTRCASQGSQMC
ncbi:protein of unknown function [Bradyrhizobium vignae]|uniref:Uncharacterized protein n=1 Tax=Bradyrhizobium vignae TaxID=1549949 RepID=A0A2U3PQL3_9BRAD|nr:protein of unknown function [Bradyrhizobium vignae]